MFHRKIVVFLICSLLLLPIHGKRALTAEDFLASGDEALSTDQNEKAIELYTKGIEVLDEDDEALSTIVSLHTNLGTALSAVGKSRDAISSYRKAILSYREIIDEIVDEAVQNEASKIAAQASFFMGLVFEEVDQSKMASEAYAYAYVLDPYHWAAVSNLGAVLYDRLRLYPEALDAYNKAYELLTQTEVEPTDPPAEPRYILSQLQYRIGLCVSQQDMTQKCVMDTDPDTPVSCQEVAANAFSRALEYDPDNEAAKHMLATITADATVKRASNAYVKSLFDEYAHNFEHSLVNELGYNGFERLRRCFDRAFGGAGKVPNFRLVVDAGCGTGLVGEQFRNVSDYLVGVDLSEAILQEAEQARPNLYDETKAGDITQVFVELHPISLIVAADSYIYFGDLDPLFQSMEEGLEDNGIAAFTLENVSEESETTLAETKPDWRWQLTASGRFAHRKEYVLDVGKEHNLELIHYEPLNDFRFEHGVGVRGHMFVMRKLDGKPKDEL